MRTALLYTSLLLALAACTPKGVTIEEEPRWRTEEGKRAVRYELLETLSQEDAHSQVLTLVADLRAEDQGSPVLDYYQGRALYGQGFYGEAERILLAYHKQSPRDARALEVLGLLYADTERPQLAIEALQEAVRRDPDQAETWNNLGFLLLSERRYPEAQEALQQAVGLDGTRALYRNNLGFALAANGHYRQAFEAFQSTGRVEDAHYNLAVAYELGEDTDQALVHYHKAIEYNPDHEASQKAIHRLETPQEND